MAALGPFEDRPVLAAAVSGGADSMALVLLLDRWARARGGEILALSVDHRLRPESAGEARQVAAWLRARGIAHRTLVWKRPSGAVGAALQARAREERYRLLAGWCRRRGVLHLALAHHAGDQAETVLMRLARGAGLDGLAGMAASLAREGVRLIRPLLLVDPRRLRASLAAAGQDWIEDPSNRDERFERIRWRRIVPPGERFTIARAAAEIGAERREREVRLADLLAEVHPSPDGALELRMEPLMTAQPGLALAALGRILMAVGGEPYSPRQESLERLLANLRAGGPASTLGGCRVAVRRGRVRILAEAGRRSRGGGAKRENLTPAHRRVRPPLMPGGFTVAKLDVNIM
jgi:tRNA(Ile)-lysidine synthase